MKLSRNVFIILLLLAPAFAGAQALPAPVQYAVAPEVPGPNQNVLIEAEGVGSFLGDATITWTQDGVVVKKGVGESSYSFTTGPLGKSTSITVEIDSSTQGSFSNTWTFNPSLVNLVWEADTTVPPLYKGKALYSAGSPLKVVAFPIVYSGASRIAPSALSYQWSQNDNPAPSSSGLGQDTFSFTGSQLNTSENVSVDVYYGAAEVAQGEITIPATAPQLLLYERDPLRGVLYDTAFPSSVTLTGTELTVQAEPFYFSQADQSAGSLTYDWQLDGQDTSGPDSASGILTLRQTGSGGGEAQISASLQDMDSNNFVQNATAAFNLIFGQTSSSGVTGL